MNNTHGVVNAREFSSYANGHLGENWFSGEKSAPASPGILICRGKTGRNGFSLARGTETGRIEG